MVLLAAVAAAIQGATANCQRVIPEQQPTVTVNMCIHWQSLKGVLPGEEIHNFGVRVPGPHLANLPGGHWRILEWCFKSCCGQGEVRTTLVWKKRNPRTRFQKTKIQRSEKFVGRMCPWYYALVPVSLTNRSPASDWLMLLLLLREK